VVLENAGTKGLYTKPCFSSRLYSFGLQVRAPESKESEELNMVLTILRTTGVVTLIEEDEAGGMCRQYYQKSVVISTKTKKAQASF
jgi:hypothetical protein